MPGEKNEIRIITGLDAMQSLGGEWNRLSERFPNPLLSFDWFFAAAGTLHQQDELNIVVLDGPEHVRAIAPLVRRRRHGIRHLEFIGSDTLREPSGVLYSSPASLRSLLGALSSIQTPILFERVSDPILVAELSAERRGLAVSMKKKTATSPWIRVGGTWEEYYGTISAKWRSAHRRAMKKAEAEGNVEISISAPDPGEFDSGMGDFIAVEHAGWKGRLGTSLAVNEPLRLFFENYGRTAAAGGILRFAFMKIGGTPVAAQYAVEYGNRIWLLKIGYDEKWSFCSPGILLMYGMLEEAFRCGVEAFEFLGNDEPWLRIWDHKKHKYYSRHIDPVKPRLALTKTLELSSRIRDSVRTRIARRGKGS